MKQFSFFLLLIVSFFHGKGQTTDCIFNKAAVTIHFGTGNVRELNSEQQYHYDRVSGTCPTDGHYTYTSFTSNCFSNDWLTLTEDHTPGDENGNMMIVNASYRVGPFLTTNLPTLKENMIYEFGVWMMNVCKPTEKCPFPLLPNITIRLQTPEGKLVAELGTGDLERRYEPQWTQFRSQFTIPAGVTDLVMIMIDNAPGGCGNDFALDDITFKECEKPVVTPPVAKTKPKTPEKKPPVVNAKPAAPVVAKTVTPAAKPPASNTKTNPPVVAKAAPVVPPATNTKTTPPPVAKVDTKTPPATTKEPAKTTAVAKTTPPPKKQNTAPKPVVKKEEPASRPLPTSKIGTVQSDTTSRTVSVAKTKLPPPPTVLITRANPVIKTIKIEPGEVRLDLYDNGTIDGDTVSIYHNNRLVVSKARLSQKAITFHIPLDAEHPRHELVMVAENLGSIPPNTSLMIVTSGNTREEVFISSSEQKNAKIIIELK